jgi:beta-lactamase class A
MTRRPFRPVATALLVAAATWLASPPRDAAGQAGAAQAAVAPGPAQVQLKTAFARQLEALADRVDGVVSYAVVDVSSGDRFARLDTELLPTASTIKIAVLYELFRQAEEGRIALDEPQPLSPAARAGGAGILQELRTPVLSLRDLATLMIVLSDNTATNAVIDAIGMDNVTRRMEGLGLTGIRLRRRMIDLEAARRGDENVATAADLASLLGAIRRGEGLNPTSRAALLEILRKRKSTPLTRAIPPGVAVASKPGGLEGVRVDAGYVTVGGRPFIIVVMGAYLADETAGDRTIEEMSRAAFHYFRRLAQGGAYGRLLPP